ncbi:MAG: hypothetical protein P4L96_04765 [Rhodoferax sp.]|nr:hypothetical protein [Rhodoferax sp.]
MPAAKKIATRKKPASANPEKIPAKPAASSAKTAAAKVVAKPKAADKPVKARKPKLVRDSFTIPKIEYGVLDELKQRAAKLAHPVKKSEVLRAGIKALAALPDAVFLTALEAVPAIKTGRPSQS